MLKIVFRREGRKAVSIYMPMAAGLEGRTNV